MAKVLPVDLVHPVHVVVGHLVASHSKHKNNRFIVAAGAAAAGGAAGAGAAAAAGAAATASQLGRQPTRLFCFNFHYL